MSSKEHEELNVMWHLENSVSALPRLLATACAWSSISGHHPIAIWVIVYSTYGIHSQSTSMYVHYVQKHVLHIG